MRGAVLYGPRDVRSADAANVRPAKAVVVVGDGAVVLLGVLSTTVPIKIED